jgi:preprotein translocase subunit SecB
VADAITRSGFAPVHLSEVNFQMFYQQRQQKLAMQQG